MRIEAIAWFDMPNNGKWHGQNVMPQQELIRCRECKHHKGYNCDRLYGMQDAFMARDDDYCSRAERREE